VAYTHYDRLTALDTVFLDLESTSVHMHVGSVGIFEAGTLLRDGALDIERIHAIAETDLRRVPRFRQKLARVPVSGHPVWVDDVRHTSLPLPGDERTLKRLAGRIMSQKLDRTKPLWELWFVEGLEDDRFAVISKVHHCLIDGISGVDLLSAFMGPDAQHRADESEHRWLARPRPSAVSLLSDDLWRRATGPVRLLGDAAKALQHPRDAFDQTSRAIGGIANTLAGSLTPASETPFNVDIGPHRRFDWTCFDLDVMREVKEKAGGTINDVVLACVAGATRTYLEKHDVAVNEIDFRAFIPVSTRTAEERGKLGNRVSLLVARLPVDEPDPRRRMERVIEETREIKGSDQIQGAKTLEELSDLTTTALLTQFSRLAASRRSYNMVVTNVPGPAASVYMEGAKLVESYPLVPLFTKQALGIALFSYDGALHWGFNSDWDAVADLHYFVELIDLEFETLRKL